VNHFLKSESRFWKNHGKLAHERNLAPKIIHAFQEFEFNFLPRLKDFPLILLNGPTPA
jgi:hypothetical protein